MLPDRRFTDRDVELYPALVQVAEDYVRNYGGSFEPLLNAQYAVVHGRALTVGQARTVLNCLRVDLSPDATDAVIRLADVIPIGTAREPGSLSGVPKKTAFRRQNEPEDDEPGERPRTRPHRTSMPARVKVDYGIAQNGIVVHTIDHSRGYYYDARGPEMVWPTEHLPVGFAGEPMLAVRWICGQNNWNPMLLPDPVVAIALGHRPCATCTRVQRERNEREERNAVN